ncbi:D-alanyl-D-alanine carboxypeptidase, partial [Streptomyces sp. SID4985]|nr:D-alanyl-D-alanine carboxypeptidase [Streptomyces sp. SID4985]
MARLANTLRAPLARATATVRPRIARLTDAVRTAAPRPARTPHARTLRYTAGAATAGLALAAGAVALAGPWDATGQRTAERDRAVALELPGGADHGGTAVSAGG